MLNFQSSLNINFYLLIFTLFCVAGKCFGDSDSTKPVPKVLVVSGPCGSEKLALLKRLVNEYPDKFGYPVLHTSRRPKTGEIEGKDYFFSNRSEIESAIARGDFLESSVDADDIYGTSTAAVENVWRSGKICVLGLFVPSVKQVKKHTDKIDPVLVFVKTPTLKDLEDRLRRRGTETEESLKIRLTAAKEEVEYGETPGNFNTVIVNDEQDKAYAKLRDFVLAEFKLAKNA